MKSCLPIDFCCWCCKSTLPFAAFVAKYFLATFLFFQAGLITVAEDIATVRTHRRLFESCTYKREWLNSGPLHGQWVLALICSADNFFEFLPPPWLMSCSSRPGCRRRNVSRKRPFKKKYKDETNTGIGSPWHLRTKFITQQDDLVSATVICYCKLAFTGAHSTRMREASS